MNLSAFQKNILSLLSSNSLAQLVMIMAAPILTRFYSASEYGIGATTIAVSLVISPLISMRYDFAISVAPESNEASELFKATLLLSFSTFVIYLALLFLAPERLLNEPFLSDFKSNGILIGIGALLISLTTSFSAWFIRENAIRQLSFSKIFVAFCTVFMQITLALKIATGTSIVWGFIVGQTAGILYMLFSARKLGILPNSDLNYKKLANALVEYKDFPLISLPGAVLSILTINLQPIFIKAQFGPSAAGQYTIARQVLQQPTTLISQSIQQIFYREVALNYPQKQETIRSNFKRISLLIFAVFVAGSVILPFFPLIFGFIFGQQWVVSGHHAQLIYVMIGLFTLSNSLSALQAIRQNKLQSAWEILRLLGLVLLFWKVMKMDLTIFQFLVYFSSYMSLFYFILWALNGRFFLKKR